MAKATVLFTVLFALNVHAAPEARFLLGDKQVSALEASKALMDNKNAEVFKCIQQQRKIDKKTGRISMENKKTSSED